MNYSEVYCSSFYEDNLTNYYIFFLWAKFVFKVLYMYYISFLDLQMVTGFVYNFEKSLTS